MACPAVRLLSRSTSVRNAAVKLTSPPKLSSFRLSTTKPPSHKIFRCPVELSSCLVTMQPFCSTVTGSVLISSTFVFCQSRSYGCLPEGS